MTDTTEPLAESMYQAGAIDDTEKQYHQLVCDLASGEKVTQSHVHFVLAATGRRIGQLEADRRRAVERRNDVDRASTEVAKAIDCRRLKRYKVTLKEKSAIIVAESHEHAWALFCDAVGTSKSRKLSGATVELQDPPEQTAESPSPDSTAAAELRAKLEAVHAEIQEMEQRHREAMIKRGEEVARLERAIVETVEAPARERLDALNRLSTGAAAGDRAALDSLRAAHDQLQGQRMHLMQRIFAIDVAAQQAKVNGLQFQLDNFAGRKGDPVIETWRLEMQEAQGEIATAAELQREADQKMEEQMHSARDYQSAIARLFDWQSFDVEDSKR